MCVVGVFVTEEVQGLRLVVAAGFIMVLFQSGGGGEGLCLREEFPGGLVVKDLMLFLL